MTLAGGNPRDLDLRAFLDAAYAIFVEEYQRVGIDLISAIEQLSQWGTPIEDEKPKVDRATQRSNERSMAELTAMLAGVKR